MRRAFALALVAGAVMWTRELGATSLAPSAGTALILGFVLLGAWLAGDLIRRFRLPRLTGYLAVGVVVGPYLGNVVTEAMATQLQFITGVATTLMALMAGLALSLDRLGARLMPVVRLALATVGIPILGLLVLGWIVWPWLPIAPEAVGPERLAMLMVVVTMIVSFSPTMTAAVIAEVGARGRLSDLVLAVVVLADLVLLVLFSVSMQVARVAFATAPFDWLSVVARVAWEVGGAVAFGVLVGALFALYMRYLAREVPLVLLGVCAVLSQAGSAQAFEPLLAAVAAGLVIENIAVAQGEALRAAVRDGATPVLIVFFVAVGVSLRLDAVAVVGASALVLVAARLALIRLGVRAGLRGSGIEPRIGTNVWTGLVSQAGITLGLAALVAAEFGEWGSQAQLLLVAAIAVNEVMGPVLFRYGLIRAGDLDPAPARPMIVVSNREPYLHTEDASGSIVATAATGGVAVALDALMRERAGVWIAHGAGSADRLVVDADDRLRVPPESPAYTLRRLWIEEPMFSAYYGGFANEGLWPLCHVADVRPRFRSEDWAAYREVNALFARAIHEELRRGARERSSDTPVFIQDYHLALVAPELRRLRPSARTALFWHIPWPYPDRLRICPWRRELLAGLLSNDLIAFQLERDRRNFLLSVEEELGAEIEAEASRVSLDGRRSTVVSVPIGVDYDRIQLLAADAALAQEQQRLKALLGLGTQIVGLGVDRLDYTKGIPERLAALDALVTRQPALRGRLTFVQIGVPSRSELHSYAAVEAEIGQLVERLNARHAVPGGAPLVRYHTTALGAFSLVALYRLARFCVVSSLHDGMNLVAKEFVAARDDERGVLVLSSMAGAAQELHEALIINPYDTDGFADALGRAIDMPADEQARRMRTLRKVVAGRDVFRWASDILEGLESLWTRPLLSSMHGWEETAV